MLVYLSGERVGIPVRPVAAPPIVMLVAVDALSILGLVGVHGAIE